MLEKKLRALDKQSERFSSTLINALIGFNWVLCLIVDDNETLNYMTKTNRGFFPLGIHKFSTQTVGDTKIISIIITSQASDEEWKTFSIVVVARRVHFLRKHHKSHDEVLIVKENLHHNKLILRPSRAGKSLSMSTSEIICLSVCPSSSGFLVLRFWCQCQCCFIVIIMLPQSSLSTTRFLPPPPGPSSADKDTQKAFFRLNMQRRREGDGMKFFSSRFEAWNSFSINAITKSVQTNKHKRETSTTLLASGVEGEGEEKWFSP